MLSRKQIDERLATLVVVDSVYFGANMCVNREREALETALAMYDMHLEVREVWPREAAERLRKLEQDNVALRALVEEHEELKSKLQVRVAELEAALERCRRLRDALVAADRLLADIGVRRAEPQTWEEMVKVVERREA